MLRAAWGLGRHLSSCMLIRGAPAQRPGRCSSKCLMESCGSVCAWVALLWCHSQALTLCASCLALRLPLAGGGPASCSWCTACTPVIRKAACPASVTFRAQGQTTLTSCTAIPAQPLPAG